MQQEEDTEEDIPRHQSSEGKVVTKFTHNPIHPTGLHSEEDMVSVILRISIHTAQHTILEVFPVISEMIAKAKLCNSQTCRDADILTSKDDTVTRGSAAT